MCGCALTGLTLPCDLIRFEVRSGPASSTLARAPSPARSSTPPGRGSSPKIHLRWRSSMLQRLVATRPARPSNATGPSKWSPCTYLTSAGLHWNLRDPDRAAKTEQAVDFVRALLDAPVPFIALENPVGCISTRIRPFDCAIQPYEFGEDASKRTCFGLKNLPPSPAPPPLALRPTPDRERQEALGEPDRQWPEPRNQRLGHSLLRRRSRRARRKARSGSGGSRLKSKSVCKPESYTLRG
jgi:hypothetical protein